MTFTTATFERGVQLFAESCNTEEQVAMLLFCCGSAIVPGACPRTLQWTAPRSAPGDGAVAVAVVTAEHSVLRISA
jgi:hypothetical protein